MPRGSVLVAGAAGLVAGAMSMAAGEYVSVKSQARAEKATAGDVRGRYIAALRAADGGDYQPLLAFLT
jgi:vacuolar iron transporter family protein